MNEIDEKISRSMYILKGLSLYSIVLAHTCYSSIDIRTLPNYLAWMAHPTFINYLLSSIGSFGVIAYLFISGYYFNPKKTNMHRFIKHKVVTIIIPWLIWGYYIYARKFIAGSPFYFNLHEILNWLLGNGTYLYFLSILIICYMVFYYIDNIALLILAIFLSILSIELTAFGVLPISINLEYYPLMYISNPYLNVLNWIGYFALGMIIHKYNVLGKLYYKLKKYNKLIIITSFMIIILTYKISREKAFWYFSKESIIIEVIMLIAVISTSLSIKNNNILIELGKRSLAIYLLQWIFIGTFNMILTTDIMFAIVRPIYIIITLYILLYILEKISIKLKIQKIFYTIFGFR